MGAELFQADRRTYMTNLIIAFLNFVNAPKSLIRIEFTSDNKLLGLWTSALMPYSFVNVEKRFEEKVASIFRVELSRSCRALTTVLNLLLARYSNKLSHVQNSSALS